MVSVLHSLRASAIGKKIISTLDVDVKRRISSVGFPFYIQASRNISELLSTGKEDQERKNFINISKATGSKTFWDVGANIGLYSWEFICISPFNEAFLFEPDSRNQRTITRTIENNSLKSAHLIKVALSDTNGQATFYADTVTGKTGSLTLGNDGETFTQRHYGANPEIIKVETRLADTMLGEINPPDIVKIDVEGAEVAVFGGADKLISIHKPILFFECLRENYGEISRLLRGKSYQLLDAITLDKAREDSFNICALHVEKHSRTLDEFLLQRVT